MLTPDSQMLRHDMYCDMADKGFYLDQEAWLQLDVPGLIALQVPQSQPLASPSNPQQGVGPALGLGGLTTPRVPGQEDSDEMERLNHLCRCPSHHWLHTSLDMGQSCKPCAVCGLGSYVSTPCNASANTRCTKCPNDKPDKSHYTGAWNNETRQCVWECDTNFEIRILNGKQMCGCKAGRDCVKCATLPDNAALINVCQMFIDASTGVCTADDSTVAGVVVLVVMPMTLTEFQSNRAGFVKSIAAAAGISETKVNILGTSEVRRSAPSSPPTTATPTSRQATATPHTSRAMPTQLDEVEKVSSTDSRRAGSVAVETLVTGRMRQILGLLTGTDALNAALAANGLPASTGVMLMGINDGTVPPPPPPPNITVLLELRHRLCQLGPPSLYEMP